MADLKQTKGRVTMRGKVFGLENENALDNREKFRKLKFRINTSADNAHFVELIDFAKKDKVYFRVASPDDKDVAVFVGLDYMFHDSSFDELIDAFKEDMDIEETFSDAGIDPDELKEEHVRMNGTVAIKSAKDDKAHYMLPEYAIDKILEEFEEGQSVVIIAEKTVSGTDTAYNQYSIKRMFIMKDKAKDGKPETVSEIDFNDPEFLEQADFEDEFIFNSIMKKPKEKRAEVEGYAVSYTGATVPVKYVVDWNEYPEDEEVANYILKNCKFGQQIRVEGVVHNRVTYGEAKSTEGVGRSTRSNKPRREIVGERRELQIIKFDKVVTTYTEAEVLGE